MDMGGNIHEHFEEMELSNGGTILSYSNQRPPPLHELLGITSEEAETTSKVLRRLTDLLDSKAEHIVHDAATELVSFSFTEDDDSKNLQTATNLKQKNVHVKTPITPQYQKNHSRGQSNVNSPKIDSERPDNKLAVLIKDRLNPEKYNEVLVSKTAERIARMQAASAKKPAIDLLNAILGCVFSIAELGCSSGLGLRQTKTDGSTGQHINPLKIEAIREYIMFHCNQKSWPIPTKAEFNGTISNKVTNSRRRLLKHPDLKMCP